MNITISKREYKQFYVNNYFYNAKKTVRIMRMYLGPTMTAFAMYLFYAYSDVINVYIIAFLIAYGIFYTAKPLILLLANKANDETFSYELKDYNLHIKDRVNEGDIDLKTNKLKENKKYFFVKLDTGQNIFFPINKLSQTKIDLFRANIIK